MTAARVGQFAWTHSKKVCGKLLFKRFDCGYKFDSMSRMTTSYTYDRKADAPKVHWKTWANTNTNTNTNTTTKADTQKG